jgi:hypothetical protein
MYLTSNPILHLIFPLQLTPFIALVVLRKRGI